MDMPYRTLGRMKPETKAEVQAQAERVKTALGAIRIGQTESTAAAQA